MTPKKIVLDATELMIKRDTLFRSIRFDLFTSGFSFALSLFVLLGVFVVGPSLMNIVSLSGFVVLTFIQYTKGGDRLREVAGL